MSENGLQRLLAIAHLSHDRDVAFDFEQRGERAEHHALILGDDNTNGFAVFLRDGIQLSRSPYFDMPDFGALPFRGTVIASRVPA